MRKNLEPFEYCEKDHVLCLHGEDNMHRIIVDEDKTQIILEAIDEKLDINIEYAIIDGPINIKTIAKQPAEETTIKSNINMKWCEFHSNVNFHNTLVEGRINFEGTIFFGYLDMRCAKFNNYVNFSEVKFRKGANFKCAIFDFSQEYYDFSNAHFRGIANFTDTKFKASFSGVDDADFSRANFDVTPKFSSHRQIEPKSFDTIALSCKKAGLNEVGYLFKMAGDGYFDKGDYSAASNSFRNAKVEYDKEGKYDEVAIMYRNIGDKYLNLRNYVLAENCFREARIEYDKDGNYRKSDRMYAMEKESVRLSLVSSKNNLVTRAWLWLLRHTCNYGESPKLLIITSIIIVSYFAFIYLPIMPDWWIFPITFKEYPFHSWLGHGNFIDNFLEGIGFNISVAIYYSTVTLLSFGDLTPINVIGRLWIGLEVICGYVMFGILITMVARKMTRS